MSESQFEQISDGDLKELIARRSPHHPMRISRQELRAFLEGRLVAKAPNVPAGKVFDLTARIERLIQMGYHKARNMSASQYHRLWPQAVTQPIEYAGRFDEPLLVDGTLEMAKLIELNRLDLYIDLAKCERLVPAPLHSETGKELTRYVAWTQTGTKNVRRSVELVRGSYAVDEVGLVLEEAVHLPGQFGPVLRKQAIDVPGTAYGSVGAPCVEWFDYSRPGVRARDVRGRDPFCESASRGIQVVPVTCAA